MNIYGRFHKPRTKREILEHFRRIGMKIGKLRKAPFKQLYAIWCDYFSKALYN